MKKIIILILLLSLTGCTNKEFDFKETEDIKFIKENKENIDKIVLKTITLLGEKCYLMNTEEAYNFLDNITIKSETNEYITDSNSYIMVHFNENIKNKYYFEKEKLYEEKIVKSIWFESTHLVHSGKKYILEKEPLFFISKDDVPENINEEENDVLIAEKEIKCEVLKQVVREY